MKCPYCWSKAAEHFCMKDGREYVKCNVCQSLYLWPRPTEEEMLEASSESTAPEQCHPDNGGHMRLTPEHRERYEREMLMTWEELKMPWRTSLPRHQTVLDIGCANGQFLDWMKGQGWGTFGVDITDTHAKHVQGHRVSIGDMRDGRYKGADFGLITAFDIIEHLIDPRSMLEAIHDALVPGGLFFLQGPRAGRISDAYKGDWRQLWTPHHCSLHTEGGIRRALYDTGFKVKQYISWGSGMGDTGQVPDRHRLAWNRISKDLNMGDEIAIVATTPQ